MGQDRGQILKDMSFFRNILLPNKHVNTDVEAGNHSDVELDDMEIGSGSAHYAHSVNPNSPSTLDPGSTFPCSFPAPNDVAYPLLPLPPAQISSTSLNINRKRSQNDHKFSKVRVVEQGSKISTIVRLYFP